MRVLMVSLCLLLGMPAAAQQLPAAIVRRLNAAPWKCLGQDLALIPCGRARIADESDFKAIDAIREPGRSPHDYMPLVWTWYGLPRFHHP